MNKNNKTNLFPQKQLKECKKARLREITVLGYPPSALSALGSSPETALFYLKY
jgi:hypothetical protein